MLFLGTKRQIPRSRPGCRPASDAGHTAARPGLNPGMIPSPAGRRAQADRRRRRRAGPEDKRIINGHTDVNQLGAPEVQVGVG